MRIKYSLVVLMSLVALTACKSREASLMQTDLSCTINGEAKSVTFTDDATKYHVIYIHENRLNIDTNERATNNRLREDHWVYPNVCDIHKKKIGVVWKENNVWHTRMIE